VIDQLTPLAPTLVPELKLWLLPPSSPLWHATSPEAHGWPYWAFAWPGGQALARHLLDHPELVRARRVVSFGAGGGVEALAAAKAGARDVLCTDLDPVACEVALRNASLNDVMLRVTTLDVVGVNIEADVLLVGDACYDEALASRVVPWLKAQAARGVVVLVGDPGRVVTVPLGEVLGSYQAPFDGDPRGSLSWRTTVTRVR
jgi:predicted nicotinamide N-methyase